MAIQKEETIIVERIETGVIHAGIVGITPFICNRLSEKTRRELLLPKGRKTASEKQSILKHDPLAEYRSSPYIMPEGAPAYLGMMSSAIKGAMMTAALDLPGTKKAQIGRLVYVEGDYIPIYGEPKFFMSITRCADMNHTPDIRTRAIIPQWAAIVTIRFVKPILNQQTIFNLLHAAGNIAGVGDWRPEKGKGNYGQFRLQTENDKEFEEICKVGYKQQQKALMSDKPECYDFDTQDLLSWFTVEVKKTGKVASV